MSVTVVRSYGNDHNIIVSTWFHSKAGDEAITCSTTKPLSSDRIIDHGCSYILQGGGSEKEIYQEETIHYNAGDILNHRFPSNTIVTATSDNSVWCYICNEDETKTITGKTLFIPQYKLVMLPTTDKPIYIACPHADIQIDGEDLGRKEIKKIELENTVIITSKEDIYIATFTYD